MISNITLHNFQSHIDTSIDFHKGVNCITGSSNSGKTAIIRALRWVLENRPSGLSVINNNKKEAFVCVRKNNQYILKRRSKTQNEYEVNGLLLQAVGKEVPKEVNNVLNLTSINIQKQLDLPFLVLESPGSIASVLNFYSKLDKAEGIISRIASDQRSNNSDIKEYESTLEGIKNNIESKKWIFDLEKQVNKHKKIVSAIEDAQKKLYEVKQIQSLMVDVSQMYNKQEVLLIRIQNEINLLTAQQDIQDKIDKTEDSLRRIKGIISDIKAENDSFWSLSDRKNRIQKEYDEVTAEILSLGECPYCGSKLTEKTKKTLLEAK